MLSEISEKNWFECFNSKKIFEIKKKKKGKKQEKLK